MKLKDITGQKFGRLTVLENTGKDKWGTYYWLCKCKCGNEKKISGNCLRSGHTQSCGCIHKEIVIKRNTKHNKSKISEYRIWQDMRYRCLNKSRKDYKNYGGRGITVCKKWLKFENFYKDMGKRPKGLTLDRIDNNGNYCKENCKWSTSTEQGRNKRNNNLITYKGETKCLSEWSEKLNINYLTLFYRLKYGWNIDRAFNN